MANDGTVKLGVDVDESGFKAGLSKLGSIAKTGLKATTAAIGSVATAATGAVAGLLSLEAATEEYRIAQGKLNTAFEAAGYSSETASQAYTDFYKILGDTDTATEASQLLAKLADSENDVSTWTNIAAGVFGTFGDSLPIEGLIEAANETAKVGQVTGTLADALNWAGISEDEFNERLAACTSESERNQLIMDTLSGTYSNAADAFYENNEALIQARENQALLDETLSQLGETVSVVKNNLISEFLPSLSAVVTAFNDLINGVDGADDALSAAIGEMVTALVEKLPEFLSFGVDVLQSILQGIIDNLPTLLDGLVQIVQEIGTALVELAPSLVEAGAQILTYIGNGLAEGIPALLEALPDAIGSIYDYIQENLPSFLEAGAEIIGKIGAGIEESLPEFIAAIPELMMQWWEILTENLPMFLEIGVSLIESILSGIVQAIPKLLEALPELITSFVAFIAENLPEIIGAGVEIVTSLVYGLISAIPNIIAALPEIIAAILEGFAQLPGMLFDIGVNIIQGLIDGVASMIGNVVDAIGNVIDSIFGTAQDEAEIHSPSKRGKWVGHMIDAGIAGGIEDNAGEINDAVRNLDYLSELETAVPVVEQRIRIANADMTPASVTAPSPVPSNHSSPVQNRTASGQQRVKVEIGFRSRDAARIFRPYLLEEENRSGPDQVD